MREQIGGWQKRLNQAWLVRVENWKRDQGHFQSQLEMLNPQRTLERGYAVILDNHKGLKAVRKPEDLRIGSNFEVKLSGGFATVSFSKVEIKR
jgi:exodeoxyribonuclease VII large subunit